MILMVQSELSSTQQTRKTDSMLWCTKVAMQFIHKITTQNPRAAVNINFLTAIFTIHEMRGIGRHYRFWCFKLEEYVVGLIFSIIFFLSSTELIIS